MSSNRYFCNLSVFWSVTYTIDSTCRWFWNDSKTSKPKERPSSVKGKRTFSAAYHFAIEIISRLDDMKTRFIPSVFCANTWCLSDGWLKIEPEQNSRMKNRCVCLSLCLWVWLSIYLSVFLSFSKVKTCYWSCHVS